MKLKESGIRGSFRAISEPPFVWAGAILVCLGVECLVCYVQLAKYRYSISTLRFFYLPIMLSLPWSTVVPLYVKLQDSVNQLMPDQTTRKQLSYFAAVSMLITYLTIFIVLGELL